MWRRQVAQLKRMRHVHVSTPVAELPEEATAVFGDKCVCIFVYYCCFCSCPADALLEYADYLDARRHENWKQTESSHAF